MFQLILKKKNKLVSRYTKINKNNNKNKNK